MQLSTLCITLLVSTYSTYAANDIVNYIMFSGQSLSIGTNSGPCLTQLQPPLNGVDWVDHSNGTSWPKYNVAYIGTPPSFIAMTCRAPQYRTISGTLSIDTNGRVTGVGTNWQPQLNNGILITAGKEYTFTYLSGTSGTVTPAPAKAVPVGTSYSLSATANGNGFFQSSESHQASTVNTITNLHPSKDWVGANITAGVQGYAYRQLKSGTVPFDSSITNLSTQAAFLSAHVPANGRPRAWTVKALDIVHGEADAVFPGAAYVTWLLEWLVDYNNAVDQIQDTPDFPMFTDQYSSWTRYAATPTVSRRSSDPALPDGSFPAGSIYWNTSQNQYRKNEGGIWVDDPDGLCARYTNGWCGTTPIAQWHAARDYPDRIKLVGPKYQYKYSDGLHMTNHSYRHLGELHGKAIAKEIHTGQKWIPLAPRSISLSLNVITARFHVPSGCLQFDDRRNDEAVQTFPTINQGFEYYDTTSSASISSVEITSCDTVTIALSGVPNGKDQRLRYAYTGKNGSIGGTAGAARGTLADTDPTVGLSGLPLRDYAITFDEPIGFQWAPSSFTTIASPQTNDQEVAAPAGTPSTAISLSPTALTFSYVTNRNAALPSPQSFTIAATQLISLSLTSSEHWLSVTNPIGTAPLVVGVSVNPAGLAVGTYKGTITVAVKGAESTPQVLSVKLIVTSTNTPSSKPDVNELIPRSGSGISGLFSARFSHSAGQAGHYLGIVLFLPLPNVVSFVGQGTCAIEFNRLGGRPSGANPNARGGMRLINNAGSDWLGPIEGVPVQPGTPPLRNDACTVDVSNTRVAFSGDDMIITVPVTFNPSAVTAVMGTFIQANDVNGIWTDLRQFGTWNVPGAKLKSGPSVGTLVPDSGSGDGTFTFSASHSAGAGAIASIHMRMDDKIVGDKACHVVWFAGGIGLVTEAGAFITSGPGQPVSTGRCSILGGWTSSLSGNTVTVNLPMSFNPVTLGTGDKKIYLNVFDHAEGVSHWREAGSRTIQ